MNAPLTQVYTLCHKEGHSYAGLYSKGYNDSILLRNVFNYWIGMFYGVLPATFACKYSWITRAVLSEANEA